MLESTFNKRGVDSSQICVDLNAKNEKVDLRLMIAYSLIKQNKGDLLVSSEGANQGTQFMFTVEMERVSALSSDVESGK